MSRIYIAASLRSRERANAHKRTLLEQGHAVVSTWHDDPGQNILAEAVLPRAQQRWIAAMVRAQIAGCDELHCLTAGPSDRCGHVWEAGYAEGLGKVVRVFGEVPTILLLPCAEGER